VVVGGARIRFALRGARSLKDKRRVVRSIKDRLPGLFGVSVAEVDDLDDRQSIVLGLSLPGNEGRHIVGVLQRALDKLRHHPEAVLVDSRIELFHLADR